MRKYQYYDTGDDNDRDAYGVNWVGQTFTVEVSHIISKVKLKLFRVGTPGTINVSIRATSAGKPTGGDLCAGTIVGTGITDDANGAWYEIPLGDGFELTIGIQYAIVIRATSGDASNKVSWRADITSPSYSGGTQVGSSDSGTGWSTYSGVDCMFEDWGVGPPSATAVTWGALPKSQISNELIETAIARFVTAHLDDENAHVDAGQSLYSHKAQEIIDHLANSIITDKILAGAITNVKIIANARAYTAIVDAAGGADYTDIQEAINYVNGLGGGAILIRPGTYTLTDDLTLYSDILLEGSKASECILDFDDNSKKIQATGWTNPYTTGLMAITNNSKIITGNGTLWDGNVSPGEWIFLTDAFYEVLSVDTDTQITLRYTYYGIDISAASYVFYIYKKNIIIKSLWIQRGGTLGLIATPQNGDGAIKLSQVEDSFIDDVFIDNSLSSGIELENCNRVHLSSADSSHNDYRGFYGKNCEECSVLHSKFNNNGYNGFDLDEYSDYNTIFGVTANHNYGDGIVFEGSRNIVLGNRALKNRYRDGEGCGINVFGSLNRLAENECSDNFIHGIKLVGETNIVKSNICEANGDSGVGSGIYVYDTLADKNIISGNGCYTNQQYGVDISSADCDKNSIIDNQLVSNLVGAIHDLGTDTEIGHNMV